jgi:DNA polymerase-4
VFDRAPDTTTTDYSLGTALDVIRDRFGADAIGPASAVQGGKVRKVKRGGQQWGPDQ